MIDLFFILGFREQAEKYLAAIRTLKERENSGCREHVSTMTRHLYVLSKFFRLHDFFAERDQINHVRHPMIYHIPYALENLQTGVEEALLEFKGKVPIVVRVYDPHSPVKMSPEYLSHHHDLVLTYNEAILDNPGFQFHLISYDNHLVGTWDGPARRKKLCCMILGNKFREDQPLVKGIEVYTSTHHGLRNIYSERDRFGKAREIDIYGSGWDWRLPNYRGNLTPFDRKYSVAREYQFNAALENSEARTYISEKILDSFLTCTVPVYLGAPNVKEYIPEETFIDSRKFKDCGELVKYLQDMPGPDYRNYTDAIHTHRDVIFDRFNSFRNIIHPIYTWYHNRVGSITIPSEDEYATLKRQLGTLRFVRNPGGARQAVKDQLRRWKQRLKTTLQK